MEVPCYGEKRKYDILKHDFEKYLLNHQEENIHEKVRVECQETKCFNKNQDCTNCNLPAKNAQQGCPISALKSLGNFCWQYSASNLFKSLSFFKAENNTHTAFNIFI